MSVSRLRIVALLGYLVAAAAMAEPETVHVVAGATHTPDALGFLLTALAVFCVNFVLSGDNSVLIAIAVTTLPRGDKIRALAIAAAFSALILIGVTFFAARLLHLPFFQVAGGLFVFWVAVTLFRGEDSKVSKRAGRPRLWRAIWLIVVAEVTMSADNVFAAAAISRGEFIVLLLGLGPSVFVVVCASGLLSFLIEKYPLLIFAVGAILGYVAAEMIMTDSFITSMFKPNLLLQRLVQAIAAVGVVTAGIIIRLHRPTLVAASDTPDRMSGAPGE